MRVVLPGFALGFNALLWLARASLAPAVARHAGLVGGWIVALLAPLALLGIALRMRAAERDALLLVAATSVALASLCTGA